MEFTDRTMLQFEVVCVVAAEKEGIFLSEDKIVYLVTLFLND